MKVSFQTRPVTAPYFTKQGEKITHTVITHVKLMDNNGKYIKFAPQDESFVEWFKSLELEIPDEIANLPYPAYTWQEILWVHELSRNQ